MASYIISYDLNKEGSEYAAANKRLTDRIKELCPQHWHHLESTWVVVTDLTHVQIRDDLKRFLDQNDELLVVKSAKVAAWTGFGQRASEWLKNHI